MPESMLRKGQTLPDGTYVYTCGCGFKNKDCPYCYGNDLDRCRAAIKTARGQQYYGLLKTILGHIGKAMRDDMYAIKERDGKAIVSDLGYIARKYDLNLKATVEWLEEVYAVKSGTYELIKDSKLKVADIMKQGEWAAVCYEERNGRHEIYIDFPNNKTFCRQCGKKWDRGNPEQPEGVDK